MGKWFSLLLMFYTLLYAGDDTRSCSLTPKPHHAAAYFIKIGAFADANFARETMLSSTFPTQIIRMRDYFSVIGKAALPRDVAKRRLKSLRRDYPDAYLITLYCKEAQSVKQEEKQPRRETVGEERTDFTEAQEAYRHGAYEEALMGFDRVLILNPQDHEAALYYIKTLMKLGLYDEANRRAHALVNEPLTRQERSRLETLLTALQGKRGGKKSHFSGFVTAGAGYDDNINLTTDKEHTRYGPYLLQNDTHKTRSTYAILSFQAAHTYRRDAWQLYTALYSYNELLHSAKENDLNFLDLSTTWIGPGKRFRWLLPAGINGSWLNRHAISYNLYANPTLYFTPGSRWRYRGDLLLLNNHSRYAEGYDYRLVSAGAGLDHFRERFKTGIYYTRQHYSAKEVLRFDVTRDVDQYRGYLEYRHSSKLLSGVRYRHEAVRYLRLDPVMGYRRHDDKNYYTLYMQYRLKSDATLRADYLHTEVTSNVNTFTYSRNSVSLLYQKNF